MMCVCLCMWQHAGNIPYPYHRKLNSECVAANGNYVPCEVPLLATTYCYIIQLIA